jgi:type IV pilus assembly protein PilA
MLKRFCERARGEAGFTLIELLVVMLILGILAAIAIPAFLNQRGKANDADRKTMARSMQTAMETCASDNTASNSYTGCTATRLNAIEPTIPASATVTLTGGGTGYIVTSTAASNTGNYFQIRRNATGGISRFCGTTATGANPDLTGDGVGGCPDSAGDTGSW